MAKPARQQVRIVGGVLKRMPLAIVDAQDLRPTPDRVRETLFNWLGSDIEGANCLDVFAGSGALGIEAASRGAARVVLNESDRRVLAHLRACLSRLSRSADEQTKKAAAAMSVSAVDPLMALSNGPFDVIFVDPPFSSGWLNRLLPHLANVLTGNGLAYIESGAALADEQVQASGLEIYRQSRAGQVHYHLLKLRSSTKET